MDTNRSREPKGTPSGGQFAPNVNPESTIELADIGDLESSDSIMAFSAKSDLERIQEIADASDGRIVTISVGDDAHSKGLVSHRAIWPNGETLRRERGHQFVTTEMLETIPDLYETEDTPLADKIVYAHFFSARGDWYITELDKEEGLAFGHCDLGMGFPEWGYVSLKELEEVRSPMFPSMPAVERDIHYEPKTARELGLARD